MSGSREERILKSIVDHLDSGETTMAKEGKKFCVYASHQSPEMYRMDTGQYTISAQRLNLRGTFDSRKEAARLAYLLLSGGEFNQVLILEEDGK